MRLKKTVFFLFPIKKFPKAPEFIKVLAGLPYRCYNLPICRKEIIISVFSLS